MRDKFLQLLKRRVAKYRPQLFKKVVFESKVERVMSSTGVLLEHVFNLANRLQNIKYAIVGGHAVSFHGRPRTTQDIDILIHPSDLHDALRMLGDPPTTPLTIGGVSAEINGTDVDFIVYDEPWVVDALNNTVQHKSGKFIAKPYLVLMKMQAKRGPQDDTDAINVINNMSDEEIQLTQSLVDKYLPGDSEDFESMVAISQAMGSDYAY